MDDLLRELEELDGVLETKRNADALFLDYLDSDSVSFEKKLEKLIDVPEYIIYDIILKHFGHINTSRESRLYLLLSAVPQQLLGKLKDVVGKMAEIKFELEEPKMRELGIGEKYTNEDLREFQRQKNEYKKEYEIYRDLALTRGRIKEFLHTNYTLNIYGDQTVSLDSPYIYFTFFELDEKSLEIFIKEVVTTRFPELELVKRIYIDNSAHTSYPVEFKAKKVKFFFNSDEDMETFNASAMHILEALFLKYKLMRTTMAKTDSIFGKYNVAEKDSTFNLNNTIAAPFTVANLNNTLGNHIPYLPEEDEEVEVRIEECYFAHENDRLVIVDKEYFDKNNAVRYIKNITLSDMPMAGMVKLDDFIYSVSKEVLDYIDTNAEYNDSLLKYLSYTEAQIDKINDLVSRLLINPADINFDVTIKQNTSNGKIFIYVGMGDDDCTEYIGDISAFTDLELEMTNRVVFNKEEYIQESVYEYVGGTKTVDELYQYFENTAYFTNFAEPGEINSDNICTIGYVPNTPTDIYLIGTSRENGASSVELDDDYTNVDIFINNKEVTSLSTDGFVTILEKGDLYNFFKEYTENYDISNMSGAISIIRIVGNYGSPELRYVDNQGYNLLDENTDTDDFIAHNYNNGHSFQLHLNAVSFEEVDIEKLNDELMGAFSDEQEEAIELFKKGYDIDITQNWFTVHLRKGDLGDPDSTPEQIWVCFQPEENSYFDVDISSFYKDVVDISYMACQSGPDYKYTGSLNINQLKREFEKSHFFPKVIIDADSVEEEIVEATPRYIVKSYNTPTTIYLVGSTKDKLHNADVKLTDDEISVIGLLNNGKGFQMETCGFLSILDEKEFDLFKQTFGNDIICSMTNTFYADIVCLDNYTGDIELQYFDNDKGKNIIMDKKLKQDFIEHNFNCDDAEFRLILNTSNCREVTISEYLSTQTPPLAVTTSSQAVVLSNDEKLKLAQRFHFLLLTKVSIEKASDTSAVEKTFRLYEKKFKDLSTIGTLDKAEYDYLNNLPDINSGAYSNHLDIYTKYMYVNSPYFTHADISDILKFQK